MQRVYTFFKAAQEHKNVFGGNGGKRYIMIGTYMRNYATLKPIRIVCVGVKSLETIIFHALMN